MTPASIMSKTVLFVSMIVFSLSPLLTQAAEQPTAKSGSATGHMTSSPSVASGAVEDSLKACMARIPTDASAGQRMMAEQSCQRDEEVRQPFQATQAQ